MNIDIKKDSSGVTIVYPSGRMDVVVSSQIEEKLNSVIDAGNHSIIINMKSVDYMSSSGFRVCIAALRKLNKYGGSLKICCIQASVRRIFDVIELTSLFDVYDTEAEALTT